MLHIVHVSIYNCLKVWDQLDLFSEEINTFISKDALNWLKVTVNETFMFQFQINAQTFISSKYPENKYHSFHENIKQRNCFQHW